jgi:hypothetical protein
LLGGASVACGRERQRREREQGKNDEGIANVHGILHAPESLRGPSHGVNAEGRAFSSRRFSPNMH